jgi:hypothetical protein
VIRAVAIDSHVDRPVPSEILDSWISRGRARVLACTSNRITDLGLSSIRALLGFAINNPTVSNGVDTYPIADVAELQITGMQLGDTSNPAPPAAGDNALDDPSPYALVTPLTVSYPNETRVVISGLLGNNEQDGSVFTEEGVFIVAGALFARTTFAPVTKTAGVAIQWDHRFDFVFGGTT